MRLLASSSLVREYSLQATGPYTDVKNAVDKLAAHGATAETHALMSTAGVSARASSRRSNRFTAAL